MSYCINPQCSQRQNPDKRDYCQACNAKLSIGDRYRLIKPLRELDRRHLTEIFEISDGNEIKVLKVLTSNRQRSIGLFQREAEVLQRLQHCGIPRVEDYFIYSIDSNAIHSGTKELHCLIMEKVSGQNLAQWMEENGFVCQELAIDWLWQIVDLLGQVHRERLLHRDIKPSNIMRRCNGQLVLIDFGTVREVTPTYIEKLERCDITSVYSPGYTAIEQLQGQAVVQSDFFSLGRTFVHLLTNIHPDDLPKTSQNQLVWRSYAPKISTWLADLIDDLMASTPEKRPQTTQDILDRIAAGQNLTLKSIAGRRNRRANKFSRQKAWLSFFKVIVGATAIASLVTGIRYLGMLQPLEFWAFDQLLRLRSPEKPDPRLLLITITEADIRAQPQRKGSLSDPALSQLMEKLQRLQPRAIGLDLYRDYPVAGDRALANRLQRQQNLIAVCKADDPEVDPAGVAPPPEIPPERIGFSDFVEDSDGAIRRHLLSMTPSPTSACTAPYAFSTMLAFRYLAAQGIFPKFTPDGKLQLDEVIFQKLQHHTGSYQRVDLRGYQVLLNYRSLNLPQQIAPQVTLSQILSDRVDPQAVKDRIVIIGTTATSTSDNWATPYGASSATKMAGVLIQAQMVSQILSAVLEKRPLLGFWSVWADTCWIWGWAVGGGLLAWQVQRSFLHLGLAFTAVLAIFSSICFYLLSLGTWVPLMPAAIALIATGSMILCTRATRSNLK